MYKSKANKKIGSRINLSAMTGPFSVFAVYAKSDCINKYEYTALGGAEMSQNIQANCSRVEIFMFAIKTQISITMPNKI
jgi:hypothetical protein